MEKNLTFAAGGIQRVRAKLTFGQADIVPTKGEAFQLIIAGDEDSLEALRVEQAGEELTVSQPQLAYAREILPRTHWLQVCLRVPEGWQGDLDIDTVTGTIGAHGLRGGETALTTVSGSMSVRDVSGSRLSLHTVSGAISGVDLRAERASLRSVSGPITVDGATFVATKIFTISGKIALGLEEGCRSIDMQSVSGSLAASTDAPVHASLHSLSGQFLLGEQMTQSEGGLQITASSVSGDLAVNRRQINE